MADFIRIEGGELNDLAFVAICGVVFGVGFGVGAGIVYAVLGLI